MTYTEVSDLITENLNGDPKIVPVKHREVEFALLNYMEDIKTKSLYPLHKGSVTIPDPGTDDRTIVTIPNVGTSNYVVYGSLKSLGYWNTDNDVFWTWGEATPTSFGLYLREVVGNVQNLEFNYFILPK